MVPTKRPQGLFSLDFNIYLLIFAETFPHSLAVSIASNGSSVLFFKPLETHT